MVKRFSVLAFILATLIHLAGTSALFSEEFRLLAEFKRTGVDGHAPAWLIPMWWIWDPVPIFFQHLCNAASAHFHWGLLHDPCHPYRGLVFLVWSICVGAIFGFLVPRFFRWHRRTI